jgi:tetratricopeptide (TPR) repeat protein
LFHLRRLANARAANWAQYARAAQIEADSGRWAEAADMLAAAVELQPGDARLLAALGDVRLGAGNWVAAAEAFARAARLRGSTWVRGNWWICGPYPGTLADVAPPEAQTSVPLPVEQGQSEKRWRLLHGGGETSLDFHSHFNWAEHVLGYAQTFLYCENEQRVTLVLGSDDAMRLWLNGREVFEHRGFLTVGQGRVDVTLAKGWNQLLAKVANDRRHHRLHLQIVEAGAAPDRAGQSNQ